MKLPEKAKDIAKTYSKTLVLLLAAVMFVSWYQFSLKTQASLAIDEIAVGEVSHQAVVMDSSIPERLRIPSLKIDTTFVPPLGLASNGEVAVPDSDTEVGWYQYSPTPGALGPAVILGHVDSYTGPAVFFYLGQLKPGDFIYVDREDGTTAQFEVTELERPKQSAFPTARVYGDIDHAGLRLITCSGTYVRGNQRYTHNLIVYAKLVQS
jgi:sortase (surface protein transpeptidase)